jgi:hypothetical protein
MQRLKERCLRVHHHIRRVFESSGCAGPSRLSLPDHTSTHIIIHAHLVQVREINNSTGNMSMLVFVDSLTECVEAGLPEKAGQLAGLSQVGGREATSLRRNGISKAARQ